MGEITIFLKLKGLECSFFFYHWFSNPLSLFIIVSNILNYRLPRNWALYALKLAPNSPEICKITIFLKLKGLECLFLFLSRYFPTHWVHLWQFRTFSIIGYPEIGHSRPQNLPQPYPKWVKSLFWVGLGPLGPNFGVTESKPRIENVLNYNKWTQWSVKWGYKNKNEHSSPFNLRNMVILPISGGFKANCRASRAQFWGNR